LFEVVARSLSYSRAASQLHVVRCKLSARFRRLAETWGPRLSAQLGKKIFLADAGRTLGELLRRRITNPAVDNAYFQT